MAEVAAGCERREVAACGAGTRGAYTDPPANQTAPQMPPTLAWADEKKGLVKGINNNVNHSEDVHSSGKGTGQTAVPAWQRCRCGWVEGRG